jgi:hypothetical protein
MLTVREWFMCQGKHPKKLFIVYLSYYVLKIHSKVKLIDKSSTLRSQEKNL